MSTRWLAAIALVTTLPVAASLAHEASTPRLRRVGIVQFTFKPAHLIVAVGDTVEWTNNDLLPHAVKGNATPLASPELKQHASWRWVAREAGSYSYVCGVHPEMKGEVTVK
jgi:plastocyanin